MSRFAKHWKFWVRVAIAATLLFDAVLLYANWRATGSGPRAQAAQRDRLLEQNKLLGADVRRVAAIRDRLPQVLREADGFYSGQFLPSSTGYSTVIADLNRIAQQSGLRASAVNFKERDLDKRGATEIGITTTVEGNYAGLVGFINGLERSENFYLLDSLSLASSTGGTIKLNLQLRTYFRVER